MFLFLFLCLRFQASLISGAREIETLRRELEVSAMERTQLQARVDELLEKASDAERLRSELERLKVSFLSRSLDREMSFFGLTILIISETY